MMTQIKNNEVESYYDTYSNRQQKMGVNERHRAIMDLLKMAGLSKDDSVLEFGCGIGTQSSLLLKYLNKEGSLTAIDLSPKSVGIARNRLSKYSNASFIAPDFTTWNANEKFDAIVMADVLEHIPMEIHSKLFANINAHLKLNGFAGINIPNPHFQDFCKNKGMEMQIIDLSIHIEDLIKNLQGSGLYLHEFKKYSVWNKEGDYQFMVLRKKQYQTLFHTIHKPKSIFRKIREKVEYEIRRTRQK
ncbi:MAG: class I SAM-dependent methyltransferase [Candidatus Woesearchaeota archaeon]